MTSAPSASIGAVLAPDGTTIGYRVVGSGPSVVLLHGAGQSSGSFSKLAKELSREFTVYVPDRRGRGLSGPCREDHGLLVEVDDLRAVLNESRARRVFGLSAGAVIAMEAALRIPEIERLAVYEPPLELDDTAQRAWVPRYERALASGDLASALVAVLKGTADRGVMPLIPRVVLVPLFRLGIRASSRTPKPPGVVSPLDLIPTIHFDAITVGEAAGPIERFRILRCDVLLLGGSRSNRNLRAAVDGLAKVLPDARRVTFPGVGHTAADDSKQPELVANELRKFFG